MSPVILFVLFFVILLFGLPISVTMGITSILPWVVDNSFAANLVMVLRQMMSGVNSLTLLAIPMFMLSGTIMARGGISRKLFDVFTYFVGNIRGGVPCAPSSSPACFTALFPAPLPPPWRQWDP